MKKFLVFLLVFTVAIGVLPAQTKKAPKPTVGKIVNLADVAMGTIQTWTKDDAVAAAEKGAAFVLMVGKGTKAKIYFIMNEDGSFAGKKIAKFAAAEKVGVVGKVVIKNGTRFIIMEMIDTQ